MFCPTTAPGTPLLLPGGTTIPPCPGSWHLCSCCDTQSMGSATAKSPWARPQARGRQITAGVPGFAMHFRHLGYTRGCPLVSCARMECHPCSVLLLPAPGLRMAPGCPAAQALLQTSAQQLSMLSARSTHCPLAAAGFLTGWSWQLPPLPPSSVD